MKEDQLLFVSFGFEDEDHLSNKWTSKLQGIWDYVQVNRFALAENSNGKTVLYFAQVQISWKDFFLNCSILNSASRLKWGVTFLISKAYKVFIRITSLFKALAFSTSVHLFNMGFKIELFLVKRFFLPQDFLAAYNSQFSFLSKDCILFLSQLWIE